MAGHADGPHQPGCHDGWRHADILAHLAAGGDVIAGEEHPRRGPHRHEEHRRRQENRAKRAKGGDPDGPKVKQERLDPVGNEDQRNPRQKEDDEKGAEEFGCPGFRDPRPDQRGWAKACKTCFQTDGDQSEGQNAPLGPKRLDRAGRGRLDPAR